MIMVSRQCMNYLTHFQYSMNMREIIVDRDTYYINVRLAKVQPANWNQFDETPRR